MYGVMLVQANLVFPTVKSGETVSDKLMIFCSLCLSLLQYISETWREIAQKTTRE